MKKILKGFSLIELIVGITISMLLMVGVGIFISGGMKNIFAGQKVLENTDEFTDFSNNLNISINNIQSGSIAPISTGSGIIFKRGNNLADGGFSYIGTELLNEVFCSSDAENPITNNIFIKSFIPFEEQGEDIFSNYDYILSSTGIIIGTGMYRSYQKENVVKDNNGNIIVGKGIFGDKFVEGVSGTGVYLNSPTGLATDNTNLYISDTLNNRVLYLDASQNIHLLLDQNDGLNEPTGLYYNDTDKALYIANSGNGEILKYSSKNKVFSPSLTLTGFNVNNVSKAEISFLGVSTNVSLSIYNTGSINFINPTTSTDYLTGSSNYLKYYFVNYNSDSNQGSCSGNEIDIIGDNPIQCVSSGTGKTSTYQPKTISSLTVNSITNVSNTGSYYINLKLLDTSNTILYQNYFPYFTQGDDILTTKGDNTLSIVHSGLSYPTGIWGAGASDFNEFGNGPYANLPYHSTDKLLSVPVKSLDITNNPNDLLTIILKYYKNYNCYNTDEKIDKTFIIKKNLK
ncbi:MAG: prepilin-type N-terminal cleavage/methylation domain-containing protein [Candidatus Gracilibacteria bacterium]|nr:prepilin-type N-terminal cleavage/methylation domain-containing protein [Candidatus Gracilibacteria bacterium]